MILRFEVDQGEAFRRGVDVEKSTNHLEVNPAELPQEIRDLIADRLDGIDVCVLDQDGEKRHDENEPWPLIRIKAKLPTFEALMEAIRENEKSVKRNKVPA